MEYLIYFGLGAVAGLISGLFGLGGGVIIVPILIIAFEWQGISADVATHLAVGTSLATIIVTSIPSIYTHAQKSAVRWALVSCISPGIVLGALMGGLFALSLSGSKLQLSLGLFFMAVALQMLFVAPPASIRNEPSKPLLAIAGVTIGSVSALFGIGGGSMTTPFLSYFGVRMHHVIGTAAACGLPIAVFSTLVYIGFDGGLGSLPDGAVGYVFLPAWLGIIITSVPMARLGALLAHRLNERRLKRLFAWLLLAVGFRFTWVNFLN